MRYLTFGGLLITLVAWSGVLAGEGQQLTGPDGAQNIQKPPLNRRLTFKKTKQITNARSRKPSASSLGSAETYAAEHSTNIPILSPEERVSPLPVRGQVLRRRRRWYGRRAVMEH